MVQNIKSLVLCAALLFLGSCTHYYYAPNTIQTPFLRERGDCTVRGGVGFGHEYTGSELQAVYSPLRHGAVMGNFFHARGASNQGNTYHDSGRGYLVEGGIGAYYPLGKYVSSSLFAGYGKGNVRNEYAEENASGMPPTRTFPSNLFFDRFFVQPSLTYRGHSFTFGLGFRLCQLRYLRGKIDYQGPRDEIAAIQRIEAATPFFLPEMVYHIGLFVKPVTFGLHITRSFVPDEALHLNSSNISLSAGVDLHTLWKRDGGR